MNFIESDDSVTLINEFGSTLKILQDDNQKITLKIENSEDKNKRCFKATISEVTLIDDGFGEIYDEVKNLHIKSNTYYTYSIFDFETFKLLMLSDESNTLAIKRTNDEIRFYINSLKRFANNDGLIQIYADEDEFLFYIMSNMLKGIKSVNNTHVKKLKK